MTYICSHFTVLVANGYNALWLNNRVSPDRRYLQKWEIETVVERKIEEHSQLLTGHSFLNSQKVKMDPYVSSLCSARHVTEGTFHFIFTCDLYKNDKDILQSTVERILNREGLNSIGDICLKTLNGVIENISKQAQNEILSALKGHDYRLQTSSICEEY